jgi:hypothetical protein
MWLVAAAIWAGCKWLTWWEEGRWIHASAARVAGYFLAWPGMNAKEFLDCAATATKFAAIEWFWAATKTLIGAGLIWLAVKRIPCGQDLLTGWMGLVGLAFFLHFGVFHLLSLLWRAGGVNAQPLMRSPALAVSVGEFWGTRWNMAFNQLVHRFVFRPLARKGHARIGCLAAFGASGLVHDLVISVPAGGGWGLPSIYFLLQGCAVLIERSEMGQALSLRHGWRGWLFTMMATAGPAFVLFHPPFIRNIVLPMLAAIGAIWRNL